MISIFHTTVLLLAGACAHVCHALGTEHFVPYGAGAGDQRLGGSELLPEKAFQFLGKPCGSIAVMVNGQIACSNSVADDFERYGMMNVFSGRNNYLNSGGIYWREEDDSMALQQISDMVVGVLPEFSGFTADWAMVITYDHMGSSVAAYSGLNNTFQAVIASGPGPSTFVIYNYGAMQWGTDKVYYKTGFYAWQYTFPLASPPVPERYSLEEDTTTLSTSSNAGVPGRYVYKVDAWPIVDPADDCRGVNCNNGECVDGEGTYACACHGVYGGAACDELRDFDCEENNPCWPQLQEAGRYIYKHAQPDRFVFCPPQADCQVVTEFYWAA